MKNTVARLYRGRFAAPLLVILFILAANGPYIVKYYNSNPINLESGLINVLQPGPLRGQPTIDPSDGYYAQSLGRRAALDVIHGHIPWWNHYEGVGAPLIGGLQAAALFPLQLVLILPNGLFYFHLSLEIIAGLGTYYFLRKIGCMGKAAVVGACAFSINGTYAWIGHTIVNPIAFLPWMLLGIELSRERSQEKQVRGWLLFAVALALSLYAGFPETGFIDAAFVLGWAAVRAIGLPRDQLESYVKKLAAGGVTGLLLAAPILVAFAGYLPDANVGLHAHNTANLILPKAALPALVMPYVYGPIFANWMYDQSHIIFNFWSNVGGFLSISLVTLAIIGLFRGPFRKADKRYLVIWTIVCVLATYGFLGVNQLVGRLPLFSSAAFARYMPPTYEFAIVVLAAMGLTYIWQQKGREVVRLVVLLAPIMIICLAILGFLGLHKFDQVAPAAVPHIKYWIYGSLAWASLVILAICGLALHRKSRLAQTLLIIVVLVDVAAAYFVPMMSAPRKAAIDLGPVIFLKQNLGQQRFFTLGPIQPNYGSYYGIASANVNDIPQPKLYSTYITTKLDPNANPIVFTGSNPVDPAKQSPLQAFLANINNYKSIGVKYLVAPATLLSTQDVTAGNLTPVYKDGQVNIFELPGYQPYISSGSAGCSIQPEPADSRDTFLVDCHASAHIIRREQFIAGWKATIDGRAVPISEYDKLMQSVAVPDGKHTLKFVYEPPHENAGYVLGIIGLLGIGTSYLRRRSSDDPRPPEASPSRRRQGTSRKDSAGRQNSRKIRP